MLECSLKYAKKSLMSELNLNQSCVPWYFPSEEDHITMCNPWQTLGFMKYFNNIPQDKCIDCLPGKKQYLEIFNFIFTKIFTNQFYF
jgi:hypothetical protein